MERSLESKNAAFNGGALNGCAIKVENIDKSNNIVMEKIKDSTNL